MAETDVEAPSPSQALGSTPPASPTLVPPTPAQPVAPEGSGAHRSFLSDMLHAVGDVLGGPSVTKHVDPVSGAIVSMPISRGTRIANAIATGLRGAGAGMAAHGPGAPGKAFLLGSEAQQQAQQTQQTRLLEESRNVRETQAAQQQKLLSEATLAKMSQDQARGALDMKFKGIELDEHQTTLANAMQEILNVPGAKLLQHFDSNDEINAHLEQIGPELARQHAIDLSRNNIRLIQNPKGGFDAVEIPKGQGETPIGEGKKLYTYMPKFDPKTKKTENVLTEAPADPAMTWDKYQQWNGTTMSSYNAAVTAQENQEAKKAEIAKTKAETAKEYALTAQEQAQTKKIIQETAAGGGPVYALDENGKTILTTKGDALNRNLTAVRPVKQADIEKDQHDIKVLNDIQSKSNNVTQAAAAMDQGSWSQAAVAAKYLADNPNTPVNTLLKSKALANASPQTRDYIIAINSLREASMGMQKVLTGTARTNETQLAALLNTLPGVEPNSDIVKRKLQAFDQNIGMLRQGLPSGTGIEHVAATGNQQLSNFHVNPQTGERIGWNGTAWVPAP